jgi:hypothetical protein
MYELCVRNSESNMELNFYFDTEEFDAMLEFIKNLQMYANEYYHYEFYIV